jgi:hypothetical protein
VKLVLLAEAEAELEDAAVWYDERSPGLGDELLEDIQRGLHMISEAPETWPRWPSTPARIPPIRRFVLQRFPLRRCIPGLSRLHRRARDRSCETEAALLDRRGT